MLNSTPVPENPLKPKAVLAPAVLIGLLSTGMIVAVHFLLAPFFFNLLRFATLYFYTQADVVTFLIILNGIAFMLPLTVFGIIRGWRALILASTYGLMWLAIVMVLALVQYYFEPPSYFSRHSGTDSPITAMLSVLTYGAIHSNLDSYYEQNPLKPVIYLYPAKKEHVSVQLQYDGTVTDVYPQFDNQKNQTWNVTAYPDGRLTDTADGKPYSYLFWEGSDSHAYDLSTGFVVKGSDTAAFLQNELAHMGLEPKEYNEFIVYWLPKLQHNPYNLIHFAGDDYANLAKLNISPTPDSVLRVFMVYKPLNHEIIVPPQTFPTFVRNGFTVVEWGGELAR